jgi:hypothetical protein
MTPQTRSCAGRTGPARHHWIKSSRDRQALEFAGDLVNRQMKLSRGFGSGDEQETVDRQIPAAAVIQRSVTLLEASQGARQLRAK